MASITSVISIFVLLLATYSYSLPVNSATDGSTPAIEVTTGKTMGDHDNSGHFHLATEEELKNMPNVHPPRASAERDSGEAATTDRPATTDQDTSSPMTSTLKTPSTEKTNGKRAYFYTYPSMVRLYDGTLATGSVLTDGTILTHGPIYTDNSLVSYVTSYRRGLDVSPTSENPSKEGEPSTDKPKDKRDFEVERTLLTPMIDNYGQLYEVESTLSKHIVLTSRALKEDIPSTSENPSKEGEPSTDKPKDKRDFKIERTLLTPMIDHFGRVYEIETPISEHVVLTSRALKEDTPSKEGEPSTDKPKDKRHLIVDRSLVSIMQDGFGRLYEVDSPLSSHLVLTSRALKEDIPSTPENPSKEGEPSTDKPKDKRNFIVQHNYLRLMSDSRGQLYEVASPFSEHVVLTSRALKEDTPSTSETPSKDGESSTDKPKDKRHLIVDRSLVSMMQDGFGQLYEVESPLSRHVLLTSRALKDEIPSKEGEPSTDKPKDKRALYYEDSSLVRLADGTIGRGSILSHGSVLSNGVMLTHGPIYDNRNMLIRDPMYIDGVARTFVSVDTRGIKDQTKDKDVSKEENSSMTGDHLATTMETSTDFEPRAIKPMDGQSGEETSTFRTNVRPQDGEKQQHSGEMMPKIPDNSKEQKADVIVPGSKQPINKA